MSTAIQIEAGPETIRAITALTEQLLALNTFFKAQAQHTSEQTADEDWLTLKEFSKRYKVSPGTIYRRVSEGRVKRLELGGRSARYKLQDCAS